VCSFVTGWVGSAGGWRPAAARRLTSAVALSRQCVVAAGAGSSTAQPGFGSVPAFRFGGTAQQPLHVLQRLAQTLDATLLPTHDSEVFAEEQNFSWSGLEEFEHVECAIR